MKSSTQAIVVVVSTFVITGVFFFGFKFKEELGQSNLLGASETEPKNEQILEKKTPKVASVSKDSNALELMRQGKTEEAKAMFMEQNAVDAETEGGALYLDAMLVKSMIDAEEFEMAALLSKSILEEKSDYRDVWIMLGYADLKMEAFQDAEDALKQAKSLDSTKPEILYFLGMAHLKQKEYEEAVRSLELALLYNFQPQQEVFEKIAESYNALGKYVDALESYKKVLAQEDPSLENFKRAFEIALQKVKDQKTAFDLATQATLSFPEEAAPQVWLSQVFLSQKDLIQAEISVEIALSQDPRSAEAHLSAAHLREAQGKTDGAKWEFKKAYDLAGKNSPTQTEAAENYNRLLNPI
jgi:Tfp pilus assembly protein PilF